MTPTLSELAHDVIGGAIAVHRALGPGLLESTYKRCLELELRARNLRFASEIEVPVIYRGVAIGTSYRLDLLVEDRIIVEVKSVEHLLPLHAAQTLRT
jgi:GxxExxY protein